MVHYRPYIFAVLGVAFSLAGGCHDSEPTSQTRYPQPAASQGDEVTPEEGVLPEEAPLDAAPAEVVAAPAVALPATPPTLATALPATPPTLATTPAPAATPAPISAPAQTPAATNSPAVTPTPSAPAQSIVLTDEQILRVVRVIDNAEISQHELAASKAHNRRVKEFAGRLLTQHMKSRHRGVLLATTAQITPDDSSMSDALAAKQASVLAELKAARLSAFDGAYLAAMIQRQQTILDLLASELMPAATNPELTTELQNVRSAVEAQLREAKELELALGDANVTH